MRKLSGINFNNIYDLSSCSSYHNLLWQKFELPQSTSSKNPGQIQIIPQVRNLLNMFKTKYYIYIYQTQQGTQKLRQNFQNETGFL